MYNMLERHKIIDAEFGWALKQTFETVTATEEVPHPLLSLKDQLRTLFNSTDTRIQDAMTVKFGDMRAAIEKQLAVADNKGILPYGSQGDQEKNKQVLDEFCKELNPIWQKAFGNDYTFHTQWIIKEMGKSKQISGSKGAHIRFLGHKSATMVA